MLKHNVRYSGVHGKRSRTRRKMETNTTPTVMLRKEQTVLVLRKRADSAFRNALQGGDAVVDTDVRR